MKKTACIVALALLAVSCVSRLPSDKRSTKAIEKYFKKYGKKYPTTPYKSGLSSVDVYSTEEIQYRRVTVSAVIQTKEGDSERVEVTMQRRAGGWKVVSWERVE